MHIGGVGQNIGVVHIMICWLEADVKFGDVLMSKFQNTLDNGNSTQRCSIQQAAAVAALHSAASHSPYLGQIYRLHPTEATLSALEEHATPSRAAVSSSSCPEPPPMA